MYLCVYARVHICIYIYNPQRSHAALHVSHCFLLCRLQHRCLLPVFMLCSHMHAYTPSYNPSHRRTYSHKQSHSPRTYIPTCMLRSSGHVESQDHGHAHQSLSASLSRTESDLSVSVPVWLGRCGWPGHEQGRAGLEMGGRLLHLSSGFCGVARRGSPTLLPSPYPPSGSAPSEVRTCFHFLFFPPLCTIASFSSPYLPIIAWAPRHLGIILQEQL